MLNFKKQGGYSLIELIIYMGVLVAITIIIVGMLVRISHTKGRLAAAQGLTTSASIAMDRMTREIRSASNINTSSSILGTSPGKLVLTGVDVLGVARTVEFSIVTNILRIKENGVDTGPLTESNVRVTNLVFDRSASSTDQAVRTRMTIESGAGDSYKSENFYSTTILRQSL
ncbi:MAG: hypothetical protein AAB660_01380 [Patescibacteria group bacterium]